MRNGHRIAAEDPKSMRANITRDGSASNMQSRHPERVSSRPDGGPDLRCNAHHRSAGCTFNGRARRLRAPMAFSNEPDRRSVAVAVTADGRRVQLPVETAEVPVLSLLRSILVGLEGFILLIAGRRENGGTRRGDRS